MISEPADVTAMTTARVISNFAWQHMKAAATFRDHVIALEAANAGKPLGPFFEDLRSYGSACIMSAAASIEALINEFFMWSEGPLRGRFADFETEFWGPSGVERKPPLEKYQIALKMLGKEALAVSQPPNRDAWALIELRNALVHYKPTWDPDRQRKIQMIEALGGQYQLSPFPDPGADFVAMRSMSAGCMRWVVKSSLNFMREFHNQAQLDEHKMVNFWRFDA